MIEKQIATALEQAAAAYPPCAGLQYGRQDLAVFTFGSLRIRCKPTREAVLAVADKYRKKGAVIKRSLYSHRKAYNQLQTVGPWDWSRT